MKADVVQRLEKSPFLKQIMLATGSSIRFFMNQLEKPKQESPASALSLAFWQGEPRRALERLQGVKSSPLEWKKKDIRLCLLLCLGMLDG